MIFQEGVIHAQSTGWPAFQLDLQKSSGSTLDAMPMLLVLEAVVTPTTVRTISNGCTGGTLDEGVQQVGEVRAG